jgi:hypothetical protein
VEVILYIGLFLLLGTALFTFAWDTIRLTQVSNAERLMTTEGRLSLELMKYHLRRAHGVVTDQSVFGDTQGVLVLDQPGVSDTLTFSVNDGILTLQVSGEEPQALHSEDIRTRGLVFEHMQDSAHDVEYIRVAITLEMTTLAPTFSTTEMVLQTGVSIRNHAL